jgi:hypothetical protein
MGSADGFITYLAMTLMSSSWQTDARQQLPLCEFVVASLQMPQCHAPG